MATEREPRRVLTRIVSDITHVAFSPQRQGYSSVRQCEATTHCGFRRAVPCIEIRITRDCFAGVALSPGKMNASKNNPARALVELMWSGFFAFCGKVRWGAKVNELNVMAIGFAFSSPLISHKENFAIDSIFCRCFFSLITNVLWIFGGRKK